MNQQEFPNQQPSLIPFDISKEQPSMIKVIGVGGGGGNAVEHMVRQNIEGVEFITVNTDAQGVARASLRAPIYTSGDVEVVPPDPARDARGHGIQEPREPLLRRDLDRGGVDAEPHALRVGAVRRPRARTRARHRIPVQLGARAPA